jgi:hypothetical protein
MVIHTTIWAIFFMLCCRKRTFGENVESVHLFLEQVFVHESSLSVKKIQYTYACIYALIIGILFLMIFYRVFVCIVCSQNLLYTILQSEVFR